MPPKKLRDVLFTIESKDHFVEKISEENKKLICIDLHLGWCGRCDNMVQNYRALHLRHDEDFLGLEFFSASEEHIPEEVMEELKFGPLSCRPRFILFHEGEKKDEVDGADFTKLDEIIQKHVPVFEKE